VQHFQYRIDRGEDVRLGAAEGGQPQRGQSQLQRAEVVTPEGEVMQKVWCTLAVIGVNLFDACLATGLRDHIRTDGREFRANALEIRVHHSGTAAGGFRSQGQPLFE
jgi:hypothetical protein